MELFWTRRAFGRLDEIGAYIAFDNPKAAKVVSRIVTAADQLREFPHSGRLGRKKNSRELVLADIPYIIVYRVVGERIQVTTIFHAAQRRPMKR
ncbi:type II toxin-antitoxin system RelE/ParE family toxin [Rhizobium sp.]